MALNGGQILAQRYEIKEYLAEGGMQQVHLATDMLLKRPVVVKSPMTSSAERRFQRSAKAAALVNHPSVTRTFDWFKEGNKEYLVEEFVKGINLEQLLKKIPKLDPYAVAHLLHGLAKGVDAVHDQKVVHRDLKPSNIMLKDDLKITSAKVTDFGVAKLAEEAIGDAVEGGPTRITTSKTAVGAIPYMAPEVIQRPREVKPAADVWALGAIAYELLSGSPPFGTAYAAIPNILEAKPPVVPPEVQGNPQYRGLGMELHGIIARCLTKDEDKRPSSKDLVRECERLCYPEMRREVGRISHYPTQTFGFLSAQDDGSTIFFHVDSVYGERPPVGTPVWFTRHQGHPRERAHPVVPARDVT
jgi:serine/threonine protein kinase